MPKLKSHSGSKKRFKVTGSGKVLASYVNKRHGLSKRTQKMKRTARGTKTMFHTDGVTIRKNFLPYA